MALLFCDPFFYLKIIQAELYKIRGKHITHRRVQNCLRVKTVNNYYYNYIRYMWLTLHLGQSHGSMNLGITFYFSLIILKYIQNNNV